MSEKLNGLDPGMRLLVAFVAVCLMFGMIGLGGACS